MNHDHPLRNAEQDIPHWNLPISFATAELLGQRLDAASDTDTPITTEDAQTIALCLSDRLGSGLHSAIRQFAEIGSMNAPLLRAESLAVRASEALSPGLKRWAAWLVTYAAHALPPAHGGLAIPTNGDALDTYLRLPDINIQSESVLAEFGHAYCGSYTDIDAVLDGVTDVLEWERKLRTLGRELGCEEFVSVDRAAIEERLREGWDVIPGQGRLNVFFR